MVISSCSIEYNINTDAVKDFKEDLMNITDTIKKVNVTFIRPQVRYEIIMTEEPTQEVLDTILEKVKSFTTVENVEEIARKVRWKKHVSEVRLFINTDSDRAYEYEYVTRYYKTAVVQDTEENIDAYKTWYKTIPVTE